MPPKFRRDMNGEMSDEELIGTNDERANLLGGEEEDDDFFLHGPQVSFSGADPRLAGLRNQVDAVTNVMRDNVGKVLERGQNLNDLSERSERLDETSGNFRSQADRIRRKAWWNDMKMKIIVGVVIGVILIVIIIIATK